MAEGRGCGLVSALDCRDSGGKKLLATRRGKPPSLIFFCDTFMPFSDLLTNELYLKKEMDRLHLKGAQSGRSHQLRQGGLPFSAIASRRASLGRLLADTLAQGTYELEPARTRRVTVHDKERVLYEFRLTDRIVHGAIASLLTDAIRPVLSGAVYSYVSGIDWTRAIADFARYVRAHRSSRPDPRMRGLYVLRRDIQDYTDSIPLGEGSAIWPLLERTLEPDPGDPASREHWEILKRAIRAEFQPADAPEGVLATKVLGVPTGSPVAPPLFNLYLSPMDRELDRIPGGFYARYCDDFLFAHPDADVVEDVDERVDEILSSLCLRTNRLKDRRIYFNGAGRRSWLWSGAAGSDFVSFLGCRVTFSGTVSLRRRKMRALLRDLSARAERTFRLTGSAPPEVSGPLVCAAINAALDPSTRFAQKSALLLRAVVTDRSQLKQIDYRIARIVLRVLTGKMTVRAFREIPYRRLRNEWGLVSLLHERNQRGRPAR